MNELFVSSTSIDFIPLLIIRPGERSQCDICSEYFPESTSLNDHKKKKIYTGERPLVVVFRSFSSTMSLIVG